MPKRHKRNSQQEKLKGVRVNRKFKDSLFRMVFRERRALLSLYNAINQSNYQNPEELEITTIEDAIYIGIKNDVSFLINDVMNLYEAQSSDNPNMPLRGLLYFAQLYQSYVTGYRLNIYSSSQQKIPTPLYIVLYNGIKPMPDISEYRLSDAFDNLQVKSSLEHALDCAVNKCIRENVLKEFLIKHKAEVKNVILTEYDAKQHIEAEELKMAAQDQQLRQELYRKYGI